MPSMRVAWHRGSPPRSPTCSGALGSRSDILVVGPGVVVREPGTRLQPDVMVYRAEGPLTASWKEVREEWLAVELLSPGSKVYDREFRRDAELA